MQAAFRCPWIVFHLVLPAVVLLQGCASPVLTTGTAACGGLSGAYWGVGQPGDNSLTEFLLRKRPAEGRPVQLQVSTGSIRASSGGIAGTLVAAADFNCSAVDRIVLIRQESSRIQLPPLIDQVKTVTYVLTGGPGMDLVLNTLVQTTISPYGAKLKGLMRMESITTWSRSGP